MYFEGASVSAETLASEGVMSGNEEVGGAEVAKVQSVLPFFVLLLVSPHRELEAFLAFVSDHSCSLQSWVIHAESDFSVLLLGLLLVTHSQIQSEINYLIV